MARDEVRTNMFAGKKDEPQPKKVETDEDSEIAKGQAAKQTRTTLEEAFTSVKESLTKEMVEGKKPEDREAAWAVLKGLDRVRLELDKVVSRGEVAQIKANKPL